MIASDGYSQQTLRIQRVSGKVKEVKNLVITKPTDAIGNPFDLSYEVSLVPSISETSESAKFLSTSSSTHLNPFWGDDFTVDTRTGFTDLKVTVFNTYKIEEGQKRVGLGKLTIPRNMLKSSDQDQWFLLQDARLEDRIKGKVQLQIQYEQDETRSKHIFTVRVVKAKDLACNGPDEPNALVFLTLLPEDAMASTTAVAPTSHSPSFQMESFTFSCSSGERSEGMHLYCSIWDDNFSTSDAHKSFLGHVLIPLAPLIAKKFSNKWYPLGALKNDSDLLQMAGRSFAKDLAKKVNATIGKDMPATEKPHKLVEKTFVSASCSVCNEAMNGAECACTECDAHFHSKCKDIAGNICGGTGLIRIQLLEFTKFTALDLKSYDELTKVLKRDRYAILQALGKENSTKADEVAKLLLKIYDKDVLLDIIRQEVRTSTNHATIFCPNSMASKVLSVLLKQEAFYYLQTTLEVVFRCIASASSKPAEIDPSKVPENESVENNATNLMELCIIIADTILSSASDVPDSVKLVFACIKEEVSKQFPNDTEAKYTCISEVFFLRFITPAIMNPGLFKLRLGTQDQSSTRKLFLISKILQNLSILAEFGSDEAFMKPLNLVITSRMKKMKTFLDLVSRKDINSFEEPVNHLRLSVLLRKKQVDPTKECADLSRILKSFGAEKLKRSGVEETLANQLEQILKRIEKQTLACENFVQSRAPSDQLQNEIGDDDSVVVFIGMNESNLKKSQSKSSMVDLVLGSSDLLDGSKRLRVTDIRKSRMSRLTHLLALLVLFVIIGFTIAFVLRHYGIRLH